MPGPALAPSSAGVGDTTTPRLMWTLGACSAAAYCCRWRGHGRLRAYSDRGSQLVARQVMRPQARWSIAR